MSRRARTLALLVALAAVPAHAPTARAQDGHDTPAAPTEAAPTVEAAPPPAPAAAPPDPAAPTEAAPTPTAPTDVVPTPPSTPSDEAPSEARALPEGHEPAIRVEVAPSQVSTGDAFHLRIYATVPEGDAVNLPRQSFGPFELIGQSSPDRPASDGYREFVFDLELLALEPGEHEIPALELRVITADGVVGRVSSPAQHMVVGSLVANEPNAEPRPPSEPVIVMQDDYTLAYVGGGIGLVLLTMLLTWLFARWWRTRPREAPPPPPPRPPWELANEKLTAIARRMKAAFEQGKQAELVDAISDALREYLGLRYGFNGLESTTDEVIARLRNDRLGGIALDQVVGTLSEADLVKFAKRVPNEEEVERMLAGAREAVRRTTQLPARDAMPPVDGPSTTMPAVAPRRELGSTSTAASSEVAASVAPPSAASPAASTDGASTLIGMPAPVEVQAAMQRHDIEARASEAAAEASAVSPTAAAPLPAATPSEPVAEAPFAESTQPLAIFPAPGIIERSDAALTAPAIPPTRELRIPDGDRSTDSIPPPAVSQLAGVSTPPSAPVVAAGERPRTTVPRIDSVRPLGTPPTEPVAEPIRPTKTSGSMRRPIPATDVPPPVEDVWQDLEARAERGELVIGVLEGATEGGSIVELDLGISALLPDAHASAHERAALLGTAAGFRILSVNVARERVLVSRRDITPSDEQALLAAYRARQTSPGVGPRGGEP